MGHKKSMTSRQRLGAASLARVDSPMRTDTAQPIQLSEYRPPAYLVDEVHLTFDLQPIGAVVFETLGLQQAIKVGQQRLPAYCVGGLC